MERGEWQKRFVSKLVAEGISHNHAMFAMAQACEENQIAYMQGYDKAWNDAKKEGKI